MFARLITLVRNTVREFVSAVKAMIAVETAQATSEEVVETTSRAVGVVLAVTAFVAVVSPYSGLAKLADALFKVASTLWNQGGRM